MAITKPKGVLVPRHTILTEYRGEQITLVEGKTRVRDGHPIVKHCGADAFVPAPDAVDFET
jgi:hypothetical protein